MERADVEDDLDPTDRLDELAGVLAEGILRMHLRDARRRSTSRKQRSPRLDCLAGQSVHVVEPSEKGGRTRWRK